MVNGKAERQRRGW